MLGCDQLARFGFEPDAIDGEQAFDMGRQHETDLSIGDRIRRERVLAGKALEHLAQDLGISSDELECHERGAKRLDARQLARIVAVLGIPLSYLSFDAHGNAAAEQNPASSPWLSLTRPLTALSTPSFAQLEPLIRLWRERRGALTGDVDAALQASKMSQRMVLTRRESHSSRLVFERIGGGFVHIRPCEGMLAIGHGFDELPDRDFGARQADAYMETASSQSIRIESVRAVARTSDGTVLNTRYDRVLLPWQDRGDRFVMGVSVRRAVTLLAPTAYAP